MSEKLLYLGIINANYRRLKTEATIIKLTSIFMYLMFLVMSNANFAGMFACAIVTLVGMATEIIVRRSAEGYKMLYDEILNAEKVQDFSLQITKKPSLWVVFSKTVVWLPYLLMFIVALVFLSLIAATL